jgi:O-antigen ligase
MVGFATHFVIFPFFGLLLSGERTWQARAIPIIGLMVDFITASRAAIGLAGGGLSLHFLISMLYKRTSRKARILAASLFVLVLLSPLAYRQLELRFNATGESEFTEGGRTELNHAAQMMLDDNPSGIGANNFFVVAQSQGYFRRANVNVSSADLMPHNSYWLTAAETGYVGILAFMVFLMRPLMVALSYGWKNRSDQRGELLLGLAMSLVAVYIHSYFEWGLLFDLGQYLYAINIGIVAGLALQLSHKSPGQDVSASKGAIMYGRAKLGSDRFER